MKIKLHKLKRLLCCTLKAAVLFLVSSAAYTQALDYSDIVKDVSECVVSLIAMSTNQQGQILQLNSDNFHRGTGIVLSQNGYVVTNKHIIEGGNRYFVELRNGFIYEGELIGSDHATDLAVIKFEIGDHPTCEFISDNEKVEAGQLILGLGSPYSLPGSVTEGVISFVDRPVPNDGVYTDYVLYIQTNLLVNPGNSGGPIINRDGKIIGMNSSLLSDSGVTSGIAFAIPANVISRVSRQLIRNGFSEKGSIGIQVSSLPKTVAEIQRLGLIERRGAVVSNVEINSSAYHAGIQVGDIVVTINRRVVDDDHKFRYLIGSYEDGDIVRLSIIRDGKFFSTEAMTEGVVL
ncbi:MAG: hypothetical protein COA71_13175 [SAR86 cluster bacterium]|uniref:PDZ domain-containing protein n=1 Tax=SAR86 cluster bacterium TaxID=2030880 RepID=A0A2A5C8N2_9GAMM|nr:trypsin-like peptidase domain-containing protein [Gammaproteobacteria bacterium AH-315-E17]PCJ39831.1 MAG: hypothetical protein COA71_13175 [SAR86 cluster bacterium]